MSGPRQIGPGGLTAFVESTGADRRDTAIILIGTAREAGLDDQHHVKSTTGGYYISDELADILYDEDAEGDEEVSGNESDEDEEQETEEPTEAPKTRSKRAKKASGDRAAKNDSNEEE